MPPLDTPTALWFAEQLQPHENTLRGWLRRRFPQHGDVDDLVQEAYVRVLQQHVQSPIASPKAYLFRTARNLALMRLRHLAVSGEINLAESTAPDIMDESADVPMAVARAEELGLLALAIQSLPTRCRQILTLRKLYGLSQKQVADQLGLSEHTIEAQSSIALAKLGDYFARYDRPRHHP